MRSDRFTGVWEGPVANVELRQFRYFIAVADELHFGKAADRLHIAQSGLSQQIGKLERALNARLFTRDRRRGVQLTETGRAFLDQARLTVELADRAVASVVLAEHGRRALLKVGTTVIGMPPKAERLLQTFGDRFPDVEVELHPRLISELIDGVSTFALDVAVVLSPFKLVDPPLRYQQLGAYELVAAVPVGHRLATLERVPRSELLEEPFLDAPRNINPELSEYIHKALFGEIQHPKRVEVPLLEEARRLELIAAGRAIGVTVMLPGAERHGVVLRPLDEDTPTLGYGVAWSATQTSPSLDSFIELAREIAGSELTPSVN
jgi:DNA-binding transcriptional LysR family regulator